MAEDLASGYDQHPDLTKVSIISALEIACWDIIGKALGQPIYNLLGGRYHEGLRSYTYLYPASAQPGMSSVQSSPQQAGERALEYMKKGFTAVKLDPVGIGSSHSPYQLYLETLSLTEAVIRGVREAVGDGCDAADWRYYFSHARETVSQKEVNQPASDEDVAITGADDETQGYY